MKKGVIELIICTQISMKVSYKLTAWFLTGMVKHSQSFQKASLQYLYIISKNKLEMKMIFCLQVNIKVP